MSQEKTDSRNRLLRVATHLIALASFRSPARRRQLLKTAVRIKGRLWQLRFVHASVPNIKLESPAPFIALVRQEFVASQGELLLRHKRTLLGELRSINELHGFTVPTSHELSWIILEAPHIDDCDQTA